MYLSSSFLLGLLALTSGSLAANTASGTANTTRYWDCCKPSCAWKGKADFNQPVQSCNKDDQPLADVNAGTGCDGGGAFACSNQSPWAVNDTFAYGFVGAFIPGGSENTWCCACYEFKFLNGGLQNKTMIVQASNTDYDTPTANVFTFAIPGGNNSFSSCAAQYDLPESVYGSNVTGVATRSDCNSLPAAQRAGCLWRFDWFEDADRPQVNFTRVACPTALTNITGCIRDDEKDVQSIVSAGSSGLSSLSSLSVSSLVLLSGFTWLLSAILS